MRIPYKIGAVSIYRKAAFSYKSWHNPGYKARDVKRIIAIDLINYVKRK